MPCSENWTSLLPIINFASGLLHLCEHLLHLLSYQLTLWNGETPRGRYMVTWDRKEVHIPEHRARHRRLSIVSSTTSSAYPKCILCRQLESPTFVAASLKSLSKLSLTISILLGTFVVSSPIRQPPPPTWHLRLLKSDIPLFFITSPTFNIASTAPWWFLILSKNDWNLGSAIGSWGAASLALHTGVVESVRALEIAGSAALGATADRASRNVLVNLIDIVVWIYGRVWYRSIEMHVGDVL